MDRERNKDPIRKRQSDVSKSGRLWEKYVETFLKKFLSDYEDLSVISLGTRRELQQLKSENPQLYKALSIEIFHRGDFHELIGDADIVVYSKTLNYPIVIVSCKLSLHGRLSETLFYAVYYRFMRKIKYVLATPDKGKQASSDTWESEWGTEENPTKDRLLAKLFLDGVYVENVEEFMPSDLRSSNSKTVLGGIVKELRELPEDILKWYEELKI